jgi:hypothetical protein
VTRAPKIAAAIGHATASRGETAEDIKREVKKAIEIGMSMDDIPLDSAEARGRMKTALKRGRRVGKQKQRAREASRIAANEKRSKAAAEAHAKWIYEANKIWRTSPDWTPRRVAGLVATRFRVERDTVYRVIRKLKRPS